MSVELRKVALGIPREEAVGEQPALAVRLSAQARPCAIFVDFKDSRG